MANAGLFFCSWLIMLCVAAVDYYPSFPQMLSGVYKDNHETTSQVHIDVTEHSGKLTVRANVVQSGPLFPDLDGSFMIYTSPPGAMKGTKAFNGTVFFQLNTSPCTYTTSTAVISSTVPLGLVTLLGIEPDNDWPCVGWDVCSGMDYLDTITYFNKTVDRWFKSIPNSFGAPDNVTVLADNKTHFPFAGFRFHPGHPGTFDPPEDIETLVTVTSTSPNNDFQLPSDWQLKCHNLDAQVLTGDRDLFYSTPKGSDFINVWLSDMPVGGNVTVTFSVHPISPCPCPDCIKFEPNPITFTASNFSQQQTVQFVYEKDGTSNFMFVVSGGGYYNRSSEDYGTVFTCQNGIPGKSCP